MGLQKGSFGSKYTQLFIGFFLSTLIHGTGAFFACREDTGEARFFMTQPLAILIEDVVIDAATWIGIKGNRFGWKILGYLWVFSWLSYSLRMYVVGAIGNGIWDSENGMGSITWRPFKRG